jgi:hypothetical protein
LTGLFFVRSADAWQSPDAPGAALSSNEWATFADLRRGLLFFTVMAGHSEASENIFDTILDKIRRFVDN